VQDKGDIVWSSRQLAVIKDAFYYGDLVGRLPGGLLSQRYGGKRLLGLALLVASLSTALIPLTARVHFSLVLLLRLVAGAAAVGSLSRIFHSSFCELASGKMLLYRTTCLRPPVVTQGQLTR